MSEQPAIRPFETRDTAAVAALWKSALPSEQPWNQPLKAICRKRNHSPELLLVAEVAGRIAGTVVVGFDGTRGWIYSLAVDDGSRRQGIGSSLLRVAERNLKQRGCPKVNLQVRGNDRGILAFYEACGYSVEQRLSLGKSLPAENGEVADPVPTIRLANDWSLGQIYPADKDAYLTHLNRSDVFYRNMMVLPYPYSELDAEQWIVKVCRETLEVDRCRNWAVRNPAGELTGGIGLCGLLGKRAEIGYWLAESAWGRGVTTLAVEAICQAAFETYGLQRVFAQVFATNPASARVLEKAGFDREGVLRKHLVRDGEAMDVWIYGRLGELRVES